jgi:D-galactarolactone cycloisomerase
LRSPSDVVPGIRLDAVEAFAYRGPVDRPIRVAFGTFTDRPSVVVRVVDLDGAEGWGEVWCNFPTVGAEHRARLVNEVVGPRLLQRSFSGPADAFETLSRELEVLVLQTGEVGPIAQAIAGIDIALWDLTARRAQKPLYQVLGGAPTESIPVYATAIGPDEPERVAATFYERGHRAFKLKTGFGSALDLRNIAALRERLGDAIVLMVDANQSLDLASAIDAVRASAKYRLDWFEEPLRVDAPAADWRALASASPIPLAGGENIRGSDFDEAIALGALSVIQPDVTKWGGISGNVTVARKAIAAGRRFCPHYFAGGIGLLASLHLLVAFRGDGLLEFDSHPNALRDLVLGSLLPVSNGRVPVPQGPGLGVQPDLAVLERYRTWAPAAPAATNAAC